MIKMNVTRPISSSLPEFNHGAFASKTIRAPDENACKHINTEQTKVPVRKEKVEGGGGGVVPKLCS